jgi:hypothetical protein
MSMTSTVTCELMNKIYEILKPMSIAQLQEAQAIYQSESMHIAAYCCHETIRRKRKGIWQ